MINKERFWCPGGKETSFTETFETPKWNTNRWDLTQPGYGFGRNEGFIPLNNETLIGG